MGRRDGKRVPAARDIEVGRPARGLAETRIRRQDKVAAVVAELDECRESLPSARAAIGQRQRHRPGIRRDGKPASVQRAQIAEMIQCALISDLPLPVGQTPRPREIMRRR